MAPHMVLLPDKGEAFGVDTFGGLSIRLEGIFEGIHHQ